MIVVSSKPGRFFNSDSDFPLDGVALPDCAPPYSMENLFADPEVCRRVGGIISKGAERRRPQRRPAPRRGCSQSSTD
jgi:hypothetical protein